MAVKRKDPLAMIDNDGVSVYAEGAGKGYDTGVGSFNRCLGKGGEIDAHVKTVAMTFPLYIQVRLSPNWAIGAASFIRRKVSCQSCLASDFRQTVWIVLVFSPLSIVLT